MKSIVDGRPLLKEEIDKIAEVAGYLWQNGWAERNGGNITVNITAFIDEDIKHLPAISEIRPIGVKLPHLKGKYFYCKGTGKRMRDLARKPLDNGSVIRILDDCESYVIIADNPVLPTSELPSHLSVHNRMIEKGSPYTATVHTHPIELIAMSHNKKFMGKDVLTQILWSMIPETKAFCPLGLGVVPYALPGSLELAEGTLRELEDYDVVLWEKHGVFAKGLDVMDAFDQIDVLEKSTKIYINARCMGYEPDGMSQEQLQEMTKAFNLPKSVIWTFVHKESAIPTAVRYCGFLFIRPTVVGLMLIYTFSASTARLSRTALLLPSKIRQQEHCSSTGSSRTLHPRAKSWPLPSARDAGSPYPHLHTYATMPMARGMPATKTSAHHVHLRYRHQHG